MDINQMKERKFNLTQMNLLFFVCIHSTFYTSTLHVGICISSDTKILISSLPSAPFVFPPLALSSPALSFHYLLPLTADIPTAIRLPKYIELTMFKHACSGSESIEQPAPTREHPTTPRRSPHFSTPKFCLYTQNVVPQRPDEQKINKS